MSVRLFQLFRLSCCALTLATPALIEAQQAATRATAARPVLQAASRTAAASTPDARSVPTP